MRLQAAQRKRVAAHREFHLNRAEAMRQEADKINTYVEINREQMSERELQDAAQVASDLQLQAIAEENGTCMDNHV